ncbi:MAG TPA: hypothetical protein DD670_03600, partial [Planctomycetaceae bacterium]|nr:hypothetical protein [Planctomycetaceae bacterium]
MSDANAQEKDPTVAPTASTTPSPDAAALASHDLPEYKLAKGNAEYGAQQLEHLSDLEHVRERPSMYIADTTTRGLHHLVYEVVDNSIDE